MNIFISGSASEKINPKYLEGIKDIAKFIHEKDFGIVCTATTAGCVGEVYNYYKEHEGTIKLIVYEAYEKEARGMLANSKQLVQSLYELQQLALYETGLTIILPGGNGTLAELYMLTDSLKSKFTTDPIIIYNCNGFYNQVKEYNDFLLKNGLIEQYQHDFFQFCDTPEDVINTIKRSLCL